MTDLDEEIPIAKSTGGQRELLAGKILSGIEVQVEDVTVHGSLEHVAGQQRDTVGRPRFKAGNNFNCVACRETADDGRRQPTLAYAENAAGTGGTLTVSDGRHAASVALLGNYMAGSFVTTADGHGGTLVSEASQTAQQPLLTQPRHG